MFVVVVVVMIVDGVEAVIVMSVMMVIMMMVDGIEEKVCQEEKSIQPFPNE